MAFAIVGDRRRWQLSQPKSLYVFLDHRGLNEGGEVASYATMKAHWTNEPRDGLNNANDTMLDKRFLKTILLENMYKNELEQPELPKAGKVYAE